MAGVYIHIPFCVKKCHYCDFYRSVKLNDKESIIDSILRETLIKKDFLNGEPLKTVYIGGGTPSLLKTGEINRLTETLKKFHTVVPDAEITFEANPDDLTDDYLKELKKNTEINRLSIGIQSFHDDDLKRMNRRHNAADAVNSIERSLHNGFENISIDLIYGLPEMNIQKWKDNLDRAFSFAVKHLSAYHLTYEPNTIFFKKLQKGELKKTGEEESIRQFDVLMEKAEKQGFIHYEISNFARDGYFSQHNSAYWMQEKYLGLGPSAHSYDQKSRHWNIADNREYISRIREGKLFFEEETLDELKKYNEYILTGLRTMWGVDGNELEKNFGDRFSGYFKRRVEPFLRNNKVEKNGTIFRLKKEGKFISDYIISQLMADDDDIKK